MADPLASFARDLRAVAKDLEGSAMMKVLDDAGDDAVDHVAVAVAGDLGSDQRMSRWPKARFDAQALIVSPTWLEISPLPRNRGPMWVAEFGRKAGMSRGTKKKAPRKVSASRGLHTWSDAGTQLQKLGPVLEGSIDKIMKRLG